MSWAFIRREWGAASFVVTVVIGVIAVPVALVLHNPSNTGATLNKPAPISTPASTSHTSNSSPSAGPHPSASPTAGG